MIIKKNLKFLILTLLLIQPANSNLANIEKTSSSSNNFDLKENHSSFTKTFSAKEKNGIIISINNLKDLLVKNNKDLKILKSQISQYQAILKSKNASWYPRLNLNSNKSPQYLIGSDKNNLTGDTSSEKLTLGIDANVEWDIIKPERKTPFRTIKLER